MHRVKVTLGAALLVGMSLPMEPALLPHSTEALAVVGSEEGRVVAEAWKVLDRAFVDPNFNGVDWRAVSFELHTLAYFPLHSALDSIPRPLPRERIDNGRRVVSGRKVTKENV